MTVMQFINGKERPKHRICFLPGAKLIGVPEKYIFWGYSTVGLSHKSGGHS